jgi:hypothetical protein
LIPRKLIDSGKHTAFFDDEIRLEGEDTRASIVIRLHDAVTSNGKILFIQKRLRAMVCKIITEIIINIKVF